MPPATKWLRSGEAIGAGAKVYGYRVDNVHNQTYRILNGINRGGNFDEVEVIVEKDSGDEADNPAGAEGAENQDKALKRK